MPYRPLVTVITPAYNAGSYIDACINSVMQQTVTSLEQIIVDDGSTDDTAERVARWNDARVRYVRLPHRGLGALADSYNSALGQARGSLIAILEADDFWPEDKLSLQVPLFDDSDTAISWGNAVVVGEQGEPLWRWESRGQVANRRISLPALFRLLTRKNVVTPAVTVMVRRQSLEQIGGFQQFPGTPFVDLPTWLLLAATTSGSARHISRNLGYYRQHAGQTSQLHSATMSSRQLAVVDFVLQRIPPEAAQRLGWGERDRRAVIASAALIEATANLQAGLYDVARQQFRTALKGASSFPALSRAVLGWLSALVSFDMLAAVRNSRRAVSKVSLRLAELRSPGARKSSRGPVPKTI